MEEDYRSRKATISNQVSGDKGRIDIVTETLQALCFSQVRGSIRDDNIVQPDGIPSEPPAQSR